jgi:hypothetical protein
MTMGHRSRKAIPFILSLAIGLAVEVPALSESGFSPYVDEAGNISRPENFRTTLVHLGSWFVPAGGASGFHDVYANRDAVEVYRKNGQFPDGAVLVKELRASHGDDYTTGKNVQSATSETKQWFVMVKDKEGRFPDNALWGEGWGWAWALFKPDKPAVNVATDFRRDCLGCHIPAQSTDWVYSSAYPTLGGQ